MYTQTHTHTSIGFINKNIYILINFCVHYRKWTIHKMMKNKKLQKHIAEWCVQGMCHDWHCTPQFPSLTLLTLNTGWCCCPATWAGCRLQLSVHHRSCAMVLLLCIINSRFKVQSECQSKPRSYILYHSCKGAWESESYNSSSKSQSQETF